MLAVEIAFWICAALILYTYVVYPMAVWALSRIFGAVPAPARPAFDDGQFPMVSVLVAAHNEEQVIAERIANALALEYPADRLEIVVASDGSSDATAGIVRGFADRRVRLLSGRERRGKARVLNAALKALRSDVVILSDANTFIDRDGVQRLVRWFADPRVGVVCGKLVLTDPVTGTNSDGLYWRYETFLKECEGRLGALLGANGAIYAIRRTHFTGIRNDTIVDDLVIPLIMHLRTGCGIVYDTSAIAQEQSAPDIRDEFRRRARIGAGGFQSLATLRSLAHPRHGWLAFSFVSHKVLRWLCPFSMIGARVTSLVLAVRDPLYLGLFAAQVAVYGVSLAGLHTRTRPTSKVVRLATMFTTMNVALLVGFWLWVSGGQSGIWQRTAR